MSGFEIALIVLAIVTLIMGGKLRAVVKESREFFSAVEDALADNKITRAELTRIVKEAKDVGVASRELIGLILRR